MWLCPTPTRVRHNHAARMVYLDSQHHNLSIEANLFVLFSVPLTSLADDDPQCNFSLHCHPISYMCKLVFAKNSALVGGDKFKLLQHMSIRVHRLPTMKVVACSSCAQSISA